MAAAGTAALGVTGSGQAVSFTVVVAMRLASLRWGLQTPLPADLGEKSTPRRRQGDEDPHPPTDESNPQ